MGELMGGVSNVCGLCPRITASVGDLSARKTAGRAMRGAGSSLDEPNIAAGSNAVSGLDWPSAEGACAARTATTTRNGIRTTCLALRPGNPVVLNRESAIPLRRRPVNSAGQRRSNGISQKRPDRSTPTPANPAAESVGDEPHEPANRDRVKDLHSGSAAAIVLPLGAASRRKLFTKHGVSNYGLWRSLASALDWGSRGRRFKSCQPDSVKLEAHRPN